MGNRRSQNVATTGRYFAPGGLLGLPFDRATTVPMAAPPAAIAAILMRNDRTCRCFAGAMAIPAGLEAAPPVVTPDCAAAAPTGSAAGFAGAFWAGGAWFGAGVVAGTGVAPVVPFGTGVFCAGGF